MKRYGKKPARLGAISFLFQSYVKPIVAVPAVFGHVQNNINWGMLGNDRAGDCVVAGAGHETMLWSRAAKSAMPQFSTQNTLADYQAASGWNGREDDPSDTGLDVQQFAEIRRTRGVQDAAGVRHKVKAYAAISSIDQLLQAVYLFGAAGLGLNMPDSAGKQFDQGQPWAVVRGAKVEGGHYVPCVGRNSRGNLMVITWGSLQAVTPQFLQTYMDEAVAYLSPEYLNAQGHSPEALNESQLDADLAALA